ncbi:hypothetical protein [Spirochaeta africana]|uniref:Lipoprotein n=1 Tax=Spirochaeta africana (strain ATCC 700263 / DSM 8902 / Z-7692) TaxID=889378 RepID=H9UH50_SPIAZ|nr:hypothetical protein [Spirochaeta africana]AFG36843.1 hypothetical protein Spiaf_0748 [Spirochaeta africana DSM 8902]
MIAIISRRRAASAFSSAAVSALLVAAVVVLGSCSLGGFVPGPIAVEGTWVIQNDAWDDEQWVITPDSITYLSVGDTETTTTFAADIVTYSNFGLNAGDTELYPGGTDMGLGYAVIRFTEVEGPGTGEVGKYQVFRWGTNQDDASTRDFTQGYNNVGDPHPDNVNEVFDTPEAAEAQVSNGNGHFSFASEGAVRQ